MSREFCGICWCPYQEDGSCGCNPLEDAMRVPFNMAQAYENGYKAGVAAEREAIIQAIPGGHFVDPQWVCDMIRARSKE